jgi:hypothetical protein
VAIVAEITADNMLRVFAGSTAAIMALPAIQRCAFKLAVKVTTGAVNELVLAC